MPSFTAGTSQRTPSKKPSLLSLRRAQEKHTTYPDTPSPSDSFYSPSHTQAYFDRYPRQSSSSNSRSEYPTGRAHPPHSQHTSKSHSHGWSEDEGSINRSEDDAESTSYTFPTLETADLSPRRYNGGELTPKSTARRRSRTNPDIFYPDDSQELSYLRISGSSGHTQFETPPQTPIDFFVPRTSVEPYPLVIAPISGVETMDALVDGMNDFGMDDMFMGGGGMSGRSGRRKERFHPLYQPPLPTPPPGITLGGGLPRNASSKQKARRARGDHSPLPASPSSSHQTQRYTSSRTASSSTITLDSSYSRSTIDDLSPPASPPLSIQSSTRTVAPSISEIIQAYAPPEQRVRSRRSAGRMSVYSSNQSHSHEAVPEDPESEPEPLSPEEEADIISRSSVDSIADEVRRTLQRQTESPISQATPPKGRSLQYRRSVLSEGAVNLNSPNFEGVRPQSFYSTPAEDAISLLPMELPNGTATQSQAIAQYLRSARLTTLLKLTRSPHASISSPLNVSLSDLGSPTGYPVVVFLGLGSVRYVMGLYDEMAECLGLRIITIDRFVNIHLRRDWTDLHTWIRWGLGRTDAPKSKSARGIPEWASAVEEVLDLLNIDHCSVMAHSAGAPYALSFASKFPERIRGDVLLLAPWVGGVEGGEQIPM